MTFAPRGGFSLVEFVIALSALAVAGTIVAQTATWAVRERLALEDRERAQAIAENLVETAKAQPRESLEAWAASVKLPEAILAAWPQSTLKISVDDDRGMKRVNVIVLLARPQTPPGKPRTLTGWIAFPAKGATP